MGVVAVAHRQHRGISEVLQRWVARDYDIIGKNPEGKEYKGKLKVKKDGDGFTFAWDAGNSFEGFGIRAGNYVAVGFGGSKCAFVGYDVQSDGTLDGKWGSQASKKFGTEVAKKK